MSSEQPVETETSSALQFDTAEPAEATPERLSCTMCSKPMERHYHLVNGQIICSSCRQAFEQRPDGSYLKALVFGTGAGLAGWAVYYAVLKLTDINFALIAILVGYMVGRAVRVASAERGGRGYQLLAVAISYVAMTSTYLPFILEQMKSEEMTGAAALIAAGIMSLIFPFLTITESPIGVLILGFGLWQAWVGTRAAVFELSGPHSIGAAAETPQETVPALA